MDEKALFHFLQRSEIALSNEILLSVAVALSACIGIDGIVPLININFSCHINPFQTDIITVYGKSYGVVYERTSKNYEPRAIGC